MAISSKYSASLALWLAFAAPVARVETSEARDNAVVGVPNRADILHPIPPLS